MRAFQRSSPEMGDAVSAGGAVGVNVAFGKAVLITAGGNEDFVIGVCVNADVFL